MVTKKQKTKELDFNEVSKLTRKYFWEQKCEEFGWGLVYLFMAFMFCLLLVGIGDAFQGSSFACDFLFSNNEDASLLSSCMNESLGNGMLLAYGFVTTCMFILVPLLCLILVIYCIYNWINSNLEKATKRAIEELSEE
jgi:hypothetical protein